MTATGAGYLTPGLKKFVDTLPGLGPDAANNLGEYIPVAVPDTTTYPGADYYEIAVVQYRHQFSSNLPPTLMRGYVQLSTTVVPGKHAQLTNANLDPNVAPAADRRLLRRRHPALPRTDHRRHEGPSRPHPVPQPVADGF